MQRAITKLIERHLIDNCRDSDDFIRTVIDHEWVNIVTVQENREAQTAGGNYANAGIVLIDWKCINSETCAILWNKALKNKVKNANEYKP